MTFSFADWYARNGEALNAKRKHRYDTDPEYRKKVLEMNKRSRERKKADAETKLAKSAPSKTVKAGFTVEEAAAYLGCTPSNFKTWIKEGVVSKPASRRYSVSELDGIKALLEENDLLSKDHHASS